jgi:hypothetical protein
MKTTVQSMRRYGSRYRVGLECGHEFAATVDVIRRDQLFAGKAVECQEDHAPPQEACKAFLMCENPATTTIENPILGDVPACQRCADKLRRLTTSSRM